MMSDIARRTGAHAVSALCIRATLLAALWWILSDGDGGWYIGAPLVMVVSVLSLWLTPPAVNRLRVLRLPAFAAWFILQSLRAGVDVARRTLHPRLPLSPAILDLDVRLPEGAPRWWLMITISLLPGTLSVRLHGDRLELHCLDDQQPVERDLRVTETRIATLFDCAEIGR